jgi:CubicO group peptidase (beta-lactamase class C family)
MRVFVAGFVYCLFAVGMAILVPARSSAQSSADRIQSAADSLLLALHARGYFNGAVVLGYQEEVYARAFGAANVEAGVPFTPDTPADGGSIAKTLTAAAVFMLQDEGLLDLDDLVQHHLPEYPHSDTRVRHLLTHSAGLPEAEYDFFNDLIPADQIRTTSLFLNVLREGRTAPAFEPGTQFRYSSLGFDVAALLIERITGQTWEGFLRTRVFVPLGMRSTFLRPARLDQWPGIRTMSYQRARDSLEVHDVFDNEGFYGGSNLYFSARDLFRWSRSFYTRPVLSEAARSRGSEAAVLWDPAEGKGGHSALNFLSWYYPETGRRFHYPGALQGFWSSVYRDEDRRYSVVYVSNNSVPQWLRPLLTRALIEIMEGRDPAPIDLPAYVDLTPDDIDAIVGQYLVRGIGTVTIEGLENRVHIRVEDGIEYPAFFVSDGQLYVPGLDVWIGFPAAPAPEVFRHLSWLSIFHVAEGERIR